MFKLKIKCEHCVCACENLSQNNLQTSWMKNTLQKLVEIVFVLILRLNILRALLVNARFTKDGSNLKNA